MGVFASKSSTQRKKDETKEAAASTKQENETAKSGVNASGTPAGAERVPAKEANTSPALKEISETDLHRMVADEKRVVLVIHGNVHDVTDFVASHPGGEQAITSRVGKEVGDVFDRIHSKTTKKMAKEYIVGRLSSLGAEIGDNATEETDALPSSVKEATVLDIQVVREDVKSITFSCPVPLELLPGGHINVLVPDASGNEYVKEGRYTPFRFTETSFTIDVKKYPGGVASSYMHLLECGQTIKYKGPLDPLWIAAKDELLQKEPVESRHVLLVAGGVGLTPLFVIAADLLRNQTASVTLVCSYQNMEALLLREEVAELVKDYGDTCENKDDAEKVNSARRTIRLHYVFTRLTEMVDVPEAFKVHLGRFGPAVVEELRPATSTVICGPPSFGDSVAKCISEGGICTSRQIYVL
ncbi:putative nitrate reductase [Trypanosoma theileri]|uniref:Putative nitrate reductase n=1 Tax=Trypanosoma theileri TaxID=67003 RepID=A0A1X0P389_9TRYP|nr:putative nitrate reductase [Trypanosoma theileri]ORC91019.1 putative nitrate reductase [Trypanosoma theileri]